MSRGAAALGATKNAVAIVLQRLALGIVVFGVPP
jgi:hypothetical protein